MWAVLPDAIILVKSARFAWILWNSPVWANWVQIVEETNLPSFGPWVCSEGSTCRLIFPGSCILDKIFYILDRIFYILDINILDFHRKYIIHLRWSWREAYNCFAFCNHSRSPHPCTWQSIIHLLTLFPWISSRVTNRFPWISSRVTNRFSLISSRETNRFSWITNKSISLPGHPMPGIP